MESNVLDVMRRELPSFNEWVEKHSPGTKAPDFEAFADLARRTQDQSSAGLKEHEASFLRMWMGALIATVEICNMERLKHKQPAHHIAAMLPRVFATACMYAFASICDEGTPLRSLARAMTDEFRAAAKMAADQLSGE